MATVNKDFKIKSGLVVEGTTGTINGYDILKKSAADDQYIIDLIGGETLVKSVEATQLEVSVAGKLSVKDNVFDDHGSAAAAQTAAAADATSKANAAQAAAEATASADATSKANAAKSGAEATASADATSKANAAQAAAEATASADATSKANAVASDLTDHENATVAHGAQGAVVGTTNTQTLTNKTIGDTLNFTGAGAMTINSDSHIVLTPAAGSSVKWGADVLATQAYADQAETDAKDYTDDREVAITTAYEAYTDLLVGDATIDGTGGNTVAARISQAVADLVDSAPALLDTLNELAEAIGDNPNYAVDLAASVGEKVDKAGDTMTGLLVLSADPTANLGAATKQYVDTAETDAISTASADATSKANAAQAAAEATASADATSKANAAQAAAEATASADATSKANAAQAAAEATASADATSKANAAQAAAEATASADATSKANAAEAAAIAHADALTTDDVAEGTANDYFTDARAKSSAADLLTGASLTNITITGTGAGLTITAENGVADSDTDDLTEGTTNLYFTDVRAVDALEAVVPNFTAVELNSVAKQVAATLSAPTAGIQVAHAFAKADYRSAEYLVKVAYGNHTEISKVLLTLDVNDNIAITEYGIVGTNGSASTISAGISGANVQLQVTTANNTSTVTVVGTLVE